MKKNISIFLVLFLSALSLQASKARQAALGGAHLPPERSLAIIIQDGDDKAFEAALKKEQSEKELTEALQNAAANQDLKYLNGLIKSQKKSADLIKKDSSIFLTALTDGGLKHVQTLEKIVSAADLKFEKNTNALQQAIEFSGADVIQHLVKKYPSMVSSIDEQGESILFLAVRRGDGDIVDQVMKIKNLPAVKTNKKGQTAQALALELGYKRIAEKVK